MSLAPEDVRRRIKAKRFNERVKLLTSTVNTAGLTILGSAILLPLVGSGFRSLSLIWILVAAALHCVAQAILGGLRSED